MGAKEQQEFSLPMRELVEVEPWQGMKVYYPDATGVVEVLETYGTQESQGTYAKLRVQTKTGWREPQLYVPLEQKFKLVSGDAAKELRGSIQRWQRENLHALAARAGGNFSGTDPEIFVENAEGRVIPAWEFLPRKEEAAAMRKFRNTATGPYEERVGGFCYWDGFQAELATCADTCLAYQVDSIQQGLAELWRKTTKQYPGGRLSSKTVVEIPRETLLTAKLEHVELGCKPSLNAYGLVGMPVEDPRELGVRFAGGHYHYGASGQKISPEDAVEMVKMADAVVGVAAVGVFAKQDNPVRRRYYGLPGEYRLPKHGVEYRTLSNAWMCHPAVAHFVLGLTRKSLGMGRVGLRGVMDGCEQEVAQIVQYCDVKGARKYVKRNEKQFRAILGSCWGATATERGMKMIMEGLESAVKGWSRVEENWKLEGGWVQHSSAKNCTWGMFDAAA